MHGDQLVISSWEGQALLRDWLCFPRKIDCLILRVLQNVMSTINLYLQSRANKLDVHTEVSSMALNIEQIVGMLMRAYLLCSKVSVQRADAHKVEINSLRYNFG